MPLCFECAVTVIGSLLFKGKGFSNPLPLKPECKTKSRIVRHAFCKGCYRNY